MANEDFSGIRNKGPLPDPQQIKVTSDLDDLMDEYVDSAASMLQELEAAALAYEAGIESMSHSAIVTSSADSNFCCCLPLSASKTCSVLCHVFSCDEVISPRYRTVR